MVLGRHYNSQNRKENSMPNKKKTQKPTGNDREALNTMQVELDPSARQSDSEVARAISAIDWNFADAKTDYLAHSIHPYPAKFIPQIPRTLISMLSEPGDVVWDPFGGSGTTALEALMLRRRCISTDVNPVAEIVGRAKTTTLVSEVEFELVGFASDLEALAASPSLASTLVSLELIRHHVPDIPNIEKWFEPTAIRELGYVRLRISELSPEAKVIALAAFSKQVLGASNQDGETRYAAVKRSLSPGDVLIDVSRQIKVSLAKLKDQSSYLQFRSAEFKTIDLRNQIVSSEQGALIAPETVDLVVTSPPYPNATDYHLYHRFRIFWLGHDPRKMAHAEIGSHLRHQKQATEFDAYIEEMTSALRNLHDALKPGGLAVLVVGDAVFKGVTYKTSKRLAIAAESIGMRVVSVVDRDLPDNKRSFMSSARRLRREQLLVLRKPAAPRKLCLSPPPYKLQPYEDVLRRQEIERMIATPVVGRRDLTITTAPTNSRLVRRLAFSSSARTALGSYEKTWQARLENGDAIETSKVGRRKDPKYITHGIHAYKGKFYPQLAKALMNISGVSPGHRILDPFCGSGTVLLEASLGGFDSVGFDINPIAVAIARAKTAAVHADAVYRDHLLGKFEQRMGEYIEGKQATASLPYEKEVSAEIASWFPASVIPMLAQVAHEIMIVPDNTTQELLRVFLSSIVRSVSHQEPRDLRIRRRAEPLKTAPVYDLMAARTREVRERLRHFARVSNYAPTTLGRADVLMADASSRHEFFGGDALHAGTIDLVVTSPPYATALPYIDTDRLSLLLCCGLNTAARRDIENRLIGTREIRNSDRNSLDERIADCDLASVGSEVAARTIQKIYRLNKKSDVGFRRKNTASLLLLYFEKMYRAVENVTLAIKAGGSAFVVIGDTRTTAGTSDVPIRSGEAIEQQFHSHGWKTEWIIPITVTRENVMHAKNSITKNDIYWFRKGEL